MTITERTTIVGTIIGLIAFVGYWAVIIARATTDGLPLTEVAWNGPLLVALLVGGGLYGIVFGISAWRARGTRTSDERDREIERHAQTAGGGLSGLGMLAALIMLALNVDTFWVANVLFTLGYLGSLAAAGVTIGAYREGVPS